MSDQTQSPASISASQPAVTERTRIPMSIPQPRLAVVPIPGYHQYWFLGRNVPRARQAGYEFVEQGEAELSHMGVSSERESADLGTRVSTPAGADHFDAQGQPERLYLMKIRQEWRDADLEAKQKRSEETLAALRIGSVGAQPGQDLSHRYTGEQNRNIFKPPKRSA